MSQTHAVGTSPASVSPAQARPRSDDPGALARSIIEENTSWRGLDERGVARAVAELSLADGGRAADVLEALKGMLGTSFFGGDDYRQVSNALPGAIMDAREAQLRGQGVPADQRALLLDVTQMTLDVAGIFDPTPATDGINAAISLFRGDLFGAGVSAVSMIPYIGDLAKAGKLGKWAQTLDGVARMAADNPAFRRMVEPMLSKLGDAIGAVPDGVMSKLPDGVQAGLASAKRKIDDVLGVTLERARAGLDEMLGRAPAAKAEIDALADEIASGLEGASVAKAPVKSRERALEKVMTDYAGDASRIKDLARNTIVVQGDDVASVVRQLEARGATVKVIEPSEASLGYSGVNATIRTESGLVAEIQVNTPAMIYAKESEPVARAIIGDEAYDAIARRTGVPGGRGHALYEAHRGLPDPASPEARRIAQESQRYYERFR